MNESTRTVTAEIRVDGDDSVVIGDVTITGRDVVDFFNDRNVRHECAACGHMTWLVLLKPPDTGGFLVVPTARDENHQVSLQNLTIPVMLLVCDRCGYVIHRVLRTIIDWKIANEQRSSAPST